MAENSCNIAEEQRVYCKVRALLGNNAAEIKNDLDLVYSDKALSYSTIRRWARLFKEGRERTKDEARAV